MKDYNSHLKIVTDSLAHLEQVETALITLTGTTNRTALDKIVKDCIDLDNSPLEAAKEMAQTMLPKALAAKQLVGLQAQLDMLDKLLVDLNTFLDSTIRAGEASLNTGEPAVE